MLPVWAACLLALWACSASSVFGNDRSAWQMVVFVAGSALVCTLIYTREFQDRTMIWQYLQPVSRLTVLGRKFAVAVALQALFGAFFLFVTSADWRTPSIPIGFAGIVSLLAVTSCCFWGVWIRNPLSTVVVSSVVALLVSMVVGMQVELVADKIWRGSTGYSPVREAFVLRWSLAAMAFYGVVNGGVAVVLWRRLQLTGEANVVSNLDVGVTSRFIGDRAFRKLPGWIALIRKEVGLVRYMFWITAIFLIAAVLFAVLDSVVEHMIALARSELSSGEYLRLDRGILWWQAGLRGVATALFVIQLALVPTLCGALAFTEEAHLGNRAWQLCQPVGWLRQCLIKFSTGLGISVAGGLVIPSIAVLVYSSLGAGRWIKPELDPGDFSQAITFHLVLFGAAAWCATWSRTSVTTVVKAFLVVISFLALTAYLATFIRTAPLTDWRIAAWTLTVLAIISTFFNFRLVDVSTRRWLGQGTLAVLVLVATLVLFRAG